MCNDKHCPCCLMHASTQDELKYMTAFAESMKDQIRKAGFHPRPPVGPWPRWIIDRHPTTDLK